MSLPMRRACVLLVAGLLSCTSDSSQTTSSPSPVAEPAGVQEWNAACAEQRLSGRVLAVTGAGPLDAQLFSVQLCPLQVGRLTPYDRFDAVAHGAGTTVVSTARNKTDAVERLEVDDLVPIPGLDAGRAFSPAVSSSGRIAYVDPEGTPEQTEDSSLVAWDPASSSESQVLTSAQLLSSPAYGPDDVLAVAEPTGASPAPHDVVLLDADGGQRRLSTPLTSVGALAWSSRGPLAVSALLDDTSPTLVLDPEADGAVLATLPAEWKVRDWSPDGDTLLLRRDAEVGIWRQGQAGPTVIGELPTGPAYDVAWLPPGE